MTETEAPVPPPTAPAPPQITAAIIAAMRAVRAVGKNGHNEDQNFKYRKYDDIVTVANEALVAAGIAITPTTVAMKREQQQVTTKSQTRRTVTTTVVHMQYTLTCAADGSAVTVDWYGEASDYGDKSLGKALSYSAKMFLIDLLKIPVDDPATDADGASHAEDAPAGEGAPAPRQRRPRAPRQQQGKAPAQARPGAVETDPALMEEITEALLPFAADPVEAGGNEALKAIWARVEKGAAEGKVSGADWDSIARHIKTLQEEIAELADAARHALASRKPAPEASPASPPAAERAPAGADAADPWANAPAAEPAEDAPAHPFAGLPGRDDKGERIDVATD